MLHISGPARHNALRVLDQVGRRQAFVQRGRRFERRVSISAIPPASYVGPIHNRAPEREPVVPNALLPPRESSPSKRPASDSMSVAVAPRYAVFRRGVRVRLMGSSPSESGQGGVQIDRPTICKQLIYLQRPLSVSGAPFVLGLVCATSRNTERLPN